MKYCIDLRRTQNPAFAAGQGAERKLSDGDPRQTFHVEMEKGRHAADLPVFPFAENEMIMARTDFPDGFGPQDVSGIGDSGTGQLPDRFGRKFAFEADQIGFFHFVAGMGQPRHEIAVVGKQDQSFAVLVQPSGGNQTDLFRLRDEIDRFFGGVAVVQGADVAPGLVQHDVKFFRRRGNRSAAEFHAVAGLDAHCAAFGGDSVDFDQSGSDQPFGSAAGTDSGCAQEFSQTDRCVIHGTGRQLFLSLSAGSFVFSAGSGRTGGGLSGTRIRSLTWDCSGSL